MAAQLDLPTKGNYKKCCHAGDALLLFALGWFRRRKPPGAPDSFTAHPVPLSGFTSPNSRRMQPRPGRGVTGPPKPKSKLPGVASGTSLPAPRGPGSGRCSNAPSPLLIRKQFRGADEAIFITPRSAIMQSDRGKFRVQNARSKRHQNREEKMPLFITMHHIPIPA